MANQRKIVIEGINPYGLVIAKRLANRKDYVVIVDKDEKLCKDTSNSLDGILFLEGEIKKDVLNKNSTTEFDIFIAASKNDGDNLISCLYVKNHHKIDKIMSIVQDEESEEAFTKEGILAANPERAAAKILLRYMAGDPKLTERITSAGESELMPIEIKPGSILEGKTISTIPLRIYKDYTIVGVYREKNKEGERTIMADENCILEVGDILQLHIHPRDHKKVENYIKK